MLVTYCDLCGQPIKNAKWGLLLTHFNSKMYDNKGKYELSIYKEEDKEICETCKKIIDEIFEKRMIGILKLAEDLKTIYSLPYNPNENKENKAKNKKNKKN